VSGSGRPGFVLDEFQRRALEHLDAGRSVLVSAPTGAGKTVVADHAVDRALAAGQRAFYTAPIKALSNQKYRDLRQRLGPNRVGLLTGDNVIAGDADVVFSGRSEQERETPRPDASGCACARRF